MGIDMNFAKLVAKIKSMRYDELMKTQNAAYDKCKTMQ
jgi:hypothetical protein